MWAPQVVRALQELHAPPEWASWPELADGTGGAKARTIDLFTMNLWPSKAYRAIAYEVKVDRADFRRELDDPSKRAPWEALATETWFAAPAGVIPRAEVPEGWGLAELQEDGTWKRPVRALQRQRPETWPMSFTASLARRAVDPTPPAPLAAWELLGRKVTIADLVKVAEALVRYRPQLLDRANLTGRHRAAGGYTWDTSPEGQAHRRAEAKRLGELAAEVQRLCGRHVRDAEAFRAWYAAPPWNAAHAVQIEDWRAGNIARAYESLGELLDALGHPRPIPLPRGPTP